MQPSYTMKVERAKEHITEANRLIEEGRPFRYTLESNYDAGERSIGVERNYPVISQIGIIVGDAIHNLRTALDHRVFQLVAPHCDPFHHRQIQFPFPKDGTEQAVKDRFHQRKINQAPKEVWAALESLKPYPGGNENLVLLQELDIMDKHILPIPTADYTQLSGQVIRKFAPDFPITGNFGAGGNAGRDFVWQFSRPNRSTRRARHLTVEKNDLPIPVEIVICETPEAPMRPLMPTLYALTEAVEAALSELAGL